MTSEQCNLITDQVLLQRISAIKNLPTLPQIYNQLVSELSKADVAMSKVATIVSQDIAISAKLLQVVNSALFGMRTRVDSAVQALNLLGVETVKGIVLAAGVYDVEGLTKVRGFLPHEIYSRAIDIGAKSRFIAYSMSLSRTAVDDALTAGLLHDVGKLVLLSNFVAEFEESLSRSKSESIALHEAEEHVLGANDAAIGAYLLTTWGLPKNIIDAVAMHYKPSAFGGPALDATAAVHLAWASEQDRKRSRNDSTPSAFDLAYTDVLGITGQLPSFVGLSPEAVAQDSFARA